MYMTKKDAQNIPSKKTQMNKQTNKNIHRSIIFNNLKLETVKWRNCK